MKITIEDLKELDDARKESFNEFSKIFSFDEWNRLSAKDQEKFELAIHFDIQHSLKAWLATEYKKDDVGEYLTLEQVLDDCYSNYISDYDGYGEWEFVQESTNKHYRGKPEFSFSCDYLYNIIKGMSSADFDNPTNKSNYVNFIIHFLKQSLELFDFKLIGIRWYNK